MSNHSGSYLLDYVLRTLDKYQILENLTAQTRHAFLTEITRAACKEWDCNAYEILDYAGKKYNICYYCYKQQEQNMLDEDGICLECQEI